jgi:hypothetical protein
MSTISATGSKVLARTCGQHEHEFTDGLFVRPMEKQALHCMALGVASSMHRSNN